MDLVKNCRFTLSIPPTLSKRVALTYIPSVNQIASGKLLYNTRSPAWRSVMTASGGMEGREAHEGGYMCILTADLLCCTAETNKKL